MNIEGPIRESGDNTTRFKEGDRVMGLVHPENPDCDIAIRGRGNLSTGVNYPGHSDLGGNAQFVSRPESYWADLAFAIKSRISNNSHSAASRYRLLE